MIRYYGTVNFIVITASILLVTEVTYFTSNQFIFLNFGHSIWLTITYSLSTSAENPTKKRPICNLLGIYNHLIYWINVAIPSLGMGLAYYYYIKTPDHTPNRNRVVTLENGYQGTQCTLNTIIFLVINFFYVANALVMYKGEPFKTSFFRNFPMFFMYIVSLILSIIFFFQTRILNRGLGLVTINYIQAQILLAIIAGTMIIRLIITHIVHKIYDSME